MSQGSNSSGGGSGGVKVATTVKTQSGRELDLLYTPLIYSDPKHGLSQDQIDAINAFTEDKWSHDRASEYGALINADGTIMWAGRGENGAINMPVTRDESMITGHTHPRKSKNGYEEGKLGGSFSVADVEGHANESARTQFAGAYEGIYFMTKQSNFDKRGVVEYSKKIHETRRKEYDAMMAINESQYRNKQIDYKGYIDAYYRAFNTMLIGLHNDYLDGQKQYGYTYGLVERTPK